MASKQDFLNSNGALVSALSNITSSDLRNEDKMVLLLQLIAENIVSVNRNINLLMENFEGLCAEIVTLDES